MYLVGRILQNQYDSITLFEALNYETNNAKRREVIYALRRAVDGNRKGLDKKKIYSSIQRAETRKRKRIVRRIYAHTTIWAMDEIRVIYPNYTYEMLEEDLKTTKKKTVKATKGYRVCQMLRLAGEMRKCGYSGEMMNKWANMFVRYCTNRNKPVLLTVARNGEAVTFDFPHSFDEENLKTFIIANQKGMPLDHLQKMYRKLRYNTFERNK